MTVLATSNLSKTKLALATTLANSARFQTWTTSATPSIAAEHIQMRSLTDAQMQDLPQVLLTRSDREDEGAGAGSGVSVPNGVLTMRFFIDFTSATLTDQDITLENNIGVILDEMRALVNSGAGDYLYIRSFSYPNGEATYPATTEDDDFEVVIFDVDVHWGLEGVGG